MDYRLTFRSPSNCTPENCDIFVGIDTNSGNSGYLDVYLEGQADGWVAVGFSNTSDMVGSLFRLIAGIDIIAYNIVGKFPRGPVFVVFMENWLI